MAPVWVLQLLTVILSTILLTPPCGMSRVPVQNSSKFWHKFCHLFCPFPLDCNADVYLSLQQIQMLLERKGLLTTLQSFPDLLQISDKLQHTTLVTLEEQQRAQVLMRFKDFFHPKETLPEALVRQMDNTKAMTSLTLSIDDQMTQHDKKEAHLNNDINTSHPDGQVHPTYKIPHIDEIKHKLATRNAQLVQNTWVPYDNVHNQNGNPDPMQAPLSNNATDFLWENIENYFNMLQFQPIVSSLPGAILFDALCKKCAANAYRHLNRHGRKLLRLLLQNSQDMNDLEIREQELEYRTAIELFNSIRDSKTLASKHNTEDNYEQNTKHDADPKSDIETRDRASRKSKSVLKLKESNNKIIPGLPQNENYQSIANQFYKAELSRQQTNGRQMYGDKRDVRESRRRTWKRGRRRKRMILKTQVCPVVQSWSNLVLAKTANGTLVQIAQFPEVNLEQWFLEEKCKYPISPILDDVTCEAKDRLVDAVIIPVSNPTLPIQTMKIKIQCCVSMYNLDDGRNKA